jgi:hypothetical protein
MPLWGAPGYGWGLFIEAAVAASNGWKIGRRSSGEWVTGWGVWPGIRSGFASAPDPHQVVIPVLLDSSVGAVQFWLSMPHSGSKQPCTIA